MNEDEMKIEHYESKKIFYLADENGQCSLCATRHYQGAPLVLLSWIGLIEPLIVCKRCHVALKQLY